MKKNQLLTIFSFALLLCSCNNGAAEKAAQEENSIYGKWELDMFGDEDLCSEKSMIEFREDGTFTDVPVGENFETGECIHEEYGVSGTFEIKDHMLLRNVTDIVAEAEGENKPSIDIVKGKQAPLSIEFKEKDRLSLVFYYTDETGKESSFIDTYKRTTKDFYKK